MTIQIETERIIFKKYCMNDLSNIQNLKSDALVWKFSNKMATDDIGESKTHLTTVLKNYAKNKYDFHGLFLKHSEEYIGEAGTRSIDRVKKLALVEYKLLSKYWNNGYATETVKALVEHLFEKEDIEKIGALVIEGNESSSNVLKKIGFDVEGILRNFAYIDNEYSDVYYYGLIRSNYIDNI